MHKIVEIAILHDLRIC